MGFLLFGLRELLELQLKEALPIVNVRVRSDD